MNEILKGNCEMLMENWRRMKNVFRWENNLISLACASMYTTKNQIVEEEKLRESKKLLKEKVGVFSSFRSVAKNPIITMISMNEASLEEGLKVYHLLKEVFFTSNYLPLVAMIIAQTSEPSNYSKVVYRTKDIYEKMKSEHPFLTSGEDRAFCALMALSDKSDTTLIHEMEKCYDLLKPHFYSRNSIQSLSHVLTLGDGTPEEKCNRTIMLYNKLKIAGRKYGTNYELPTLGILALLNENLDEIVDKIVEIDEWLSNQKGFGFFGGISSKQRLMYAGILTQCEYISSSDTMQTAALNSTISIVIAQEAAMCAAIAASASASSASSSS